MTLRKRLFDAAGRLSPADYILIIIPSLFFGIYGIGTRVFDSKTIAIIIAAFVCCILIGDRLFWHSPLEKH